jgi:hypothetical protein
MPKAIKFSLCAGHYLASISGVVTAFGNVHEPFQKVIESIKVVILMFLQL